MRTVPGVRKAVKRNSPFYGVEGQGWVLSFHAFPNYVKVTFFQGTSLRPVPPGRKAKDARWNDIHKDGLDETMMRRGSGGRLPCPARVSPRRRVSVTVAGEQVEPSDHRLQRTAFLRR